MNIHIWSWKQDHPILTTVVVVVWILTDYYYYCCCISMIVDTRQDSQVYVVVASTALHSALLVHCTCQHLWRQLLLPSKQLGDRYLAISVGLISVSPYYYYCCTVVCCTWYLINRNISPPII